jgi:hypothetical protein
MAARKSAKNSFREKIIRSEESFLSTMSDDFAIMRTQSEMCAREFFAAY